MERIKLMIFGDIAKGVITGGVDSTLGRLFDKLMPNREGRKKHDRDIETAKQEFLSIVETGLQAEKEAQSEIQLSQLRINAAEAVHRSIFVAGWRPGAAWICLAALLLNILIFPIAEWGLQFTDYDIDMPNIPENTYMLILGPLLGLGGMRSWDKKNGKTK